MKFTIGNPLEAMRKSRCAFCMLVKAFFHNFQSKKKGNYFGEVAFFSGDKRIASAKALDFTTLYVLQRTDFMEILKDNLEDYVKNNLNKKNKNNNKYNKIYNNINSLFYQIYRKNFIC